MTVLLDDHLLLARLTDRIPHLGLDPDEQPATTNLFLVRLVRSALGHTGQGRLLGSWSRSRIDDVRPGLLDLRLSTTIVPLADLAWEVGALVERHSLSTLGAECIAAATALNAEICVWEGNDGPRIRDAADAEGITYRTVPI